MTLNAYIDESEDSSVFVLAGYAALAEDWSAFSEDWTEVLRTTPAIWALKTRDAMGLKGSFNGWSPAARDAKLCVLYAAIDRHVAFELSAVVPMEPFRRLFCDGSLPKKAGQPYYHALSGLVSDLARHQISIGMTEKVDFVFDERVIEQGKVLAIWPDVTATAPSDVKPMLGKTPVFGSDKNLPPLQAADLEAWWLRQRWRERLTGADYLEYPWQPADIPGVTCVFEEAKLREIHEKILRAHIELGWRPDHGDPVFDRLTV